MGLVLHYADMGGAKAVIVSNRLPISFIEEAGGVKQKRSLGGLATAMDSVVKRLDARWIGWTGLNRELSAHELASLELSDRHIPVQADAALLKGYYDGYSNSQLWPMLHGKRSSSPVTGADWSAYEAMNLRFARVVRQNLDPKGLVWVHDYHLMLLPQHLRQLGVTNPIGFFLHVPFPRSLPWLQPAQGKRLIEGMAAADVIGMQRKQDVQHFLAYATSLGLNAVDAPEVFPIGVDVQAFAAAGSRAEVKRLRQDIAKATDGKRIIFSLSRMDYTKGLITQIQAVGRFLEHCPRRQDFMYKLIVAPSREHLPDYERLSREVEREVRRVNAALGTAAWQPIDYEHRAIGFEEVSAWYSQSEMLLLLPSADGMNLIAKEYVVARRGNPGTIVLSTATGSSDQLRDALLVPPDDASAAALALAHAAYMPGRERLQRWHGLHAVVQDQDIFWWAETFLRRLRQKRSTQTVSPNLIASATI